MLHDLYQRLALLVAPFYVLLTATRARATRTAIVGQSGISAMMAFTDTDDTVIFLDKTENNPLKVNGRPAWATSFNVETQELGPFDIVTNTFCAGGAPAGDGTMVVSGGNGAVGLGGKATNESVAPYFSVDGRFALNIWNATTKSFTSRRKGLARKRWYPSMEPLADGRVAIIGGQSGGGYSGTVNINEPTMEFYPARGVVKLPILERAVPINLYPLTYLMSNGNMFIQAYNEAVLWDLTTHTEHALPTKPGAPGPYPASQAVVLLPLTPENDYMETVLFCGGIEGMSKADWGGSHGPNVSVTLRPNSKACQAISPLGDRQWTSPTQAPEGRTMAIFVNLPDGKIMWVGGGRYGSAGYGSPHSVGKPVGYSFSNVPGLSVWLLDPTTFEWTFAGSITKPRLYHSTATLLSDGSVIIAGSNPNPDVSTTVTYHTEYTVERWFPSWYEQPRPCRDFLPETFEYGHAFRISLRGSCKEGGINLMILSAKLRIIRTGFSTHAVQWGQRSLDVDARIVDDFLEGTFVSNPNLFAPGPAMAFLVINRIPSRGKFVHIGPKSLPGEV